MSSIVDALQHPAASIAIALVFLLLVVSGFGFFSLFGSVVLLVYLGIAAFVLWLLWRGVRALERLADAAEAQSYEGFDD
ncbi:hypothetical protein [Halogranum rubrum]|uniref:Uncharacterized protein n=1 Tax=Halogranum salarium B-1 TaxID=1210908 RepID=J3JF00_9EURY|nr:hypothetical protein [Halogranum salarium]EJN58824.1 hypothetical protein HSB1_29050 [Halogranum salarium B-1]